MNKFFSLMGFSIILFVSSSVYAEKIAVINFDKIFQEIATKKAISKQLEKEFQGSANELQNMEKDLQFHVEQFQKSTIKPNEQDLKKFEVKRTDFLKKAEQFERNNQRRRQEEHAKILKSIKMATKVVAEKEKYDVIFDINEVMYLKEGLNLKNITDLVLNKVK
ncbi:OmpH family outer membrane protein [Arsenophonus symbiont of Ornithomya chloropus]|uniref:OmpH family outer membrane protein n=1 Tax=Arsenophonus symbiont of Ornithomya chloropus TaxID=634121 RepID=UPI0032B1C72F